MPFLPSYVTVQAPGSEPFATVFVLHGILGSSRNVRTLAVHLAAATPGLRYVLIDLRNHGDSTGAAPPHSIAACAHDLLALAAHLGVQPVAVVGHSFGGKVALAYARLAPAGLRQVWVLDATPQARSGADESPHAVEALIATLRDVPQPLENRQAVVRELAARGCPPEICQWMTTNVRPGAGGLVWRFDLPAVEQMLASYLQEDAWPLLDDPPPGLRIDFVRAERSDRWTPDILQRFHDLPGDRVGLHLLRDAGHWLHADNLSGLVALLSPSLSACR